MNFRKLSSGLPLSYHFFVTVIWNCWIKIPGQIPGRIDNFGRGRGQPGVAILAGAGAGDPVGLCSSVT